MRVRKGGGSSGKKLGTTDRANNKIGLLGRYKILLNSCKKNDLTKDMHRPYRKTDR
jgi:hypothetical protein|tara:strand:- start:805 stop:972 length:168 start_codon:yes stop_codon:yes gene_type:complete